MRHNTEFGKELATLYLSVTDFCNLQCDYCSANAGPDKEQYLDENQALETVTQWLKKLKQPFAQLIFTGGEAVFWGYEKLDRVCEQVYQLAKFMKINIHIGIQSNGTVASAKFIAFCKRWNVEPSFSLDGMPSLSDQHRGLGEKVLRNLKKLQAENIQFGLIICLTREVADNIEQILDFLEDNNFYKVRVNVVGSPPDGNDFDNVKAEDIFRVKKALYQRSQQAGTQVLKEYNTTRQILWFDQFLRGIKPAKGHCENYNCEAGQKVAVINPDGRWGMCVEKSMTDGLPVYDTGKNMEVGAGIFWSKQQLWNQCSTCPARPICDHGCIAYHKGKHESFREECKANQKFWKFLLQIRLLQQSCPKLVSSTNFGQV